MARSFRQIHLPQECLITRIHFETAQKPVALYVLQLGVLLGIGPVEPAEGLVTRRAISVDLCYAKRVTVCI